MGLCALVQLRMQVTYRAFAALFDYRNAETIIFNAQPIGKIGTQGHAAMFIINDGADAEIRTISAAGTSAI